MTIFYVVYEASPRPESEDFKLWGGAFINCWVKAQSEKEAHQSALTFIHVRGWKVLSIFQECQEVTEVFFSNAQECLDYYRQAEAEGESYMFRMWPAEAKDGYHVQRGQRK
jgi:hypothetical protein